MHSRIQLGVWLKTQNWPQRLKGTKKLTRRNEVFTHLGVFATSCLHAKVRRFGTQAWRYCSTDSLALLALTALIIVCTVASPAQNSKAGAQDTTQVQRADSASRGAQTDPVGQSTIHRHCSVGPYTRKRSDLPGSHRKRRGLHSRHVGLRSCDYAFGEQRHRPQRAPD